MAVNQEVLYDRLWHQHYAFEYWYNRVEKINPHNDRDRLEALYSLAELAELYSRSFSSMLQNPNYAWLYLDNIVTIDNTTNALELLKHQADLAIGKTSKVTGLTNSIDSDSTAEFSEIDALSISLLGVPQEIDENEKITLPESPVFHRNICDSILQIAERQKPLKDSFDRGFRVFPVSLDTVKTEIESTKLVDESQKEAVKTEIDSLQKQFNSERWPLTYFHINHKKTEDENTVQLFLKHVDAFTCYKLAEFVLDALYNLISVGPGYRLEHLAADLPVDIIDEEPMINEPIFSIETQIGEESFRFITQEDINNYQ